MLLNNVEMRFLFVTPSKRLGGGESLAPGFLEA